MVRFWIITVVVANFSCAWAQQKALVAAPSPNNPANASAQYSSLLQQTFFPRTTLQRSWYWEANIFTQVPSLANKYLPKGVVTNNSDFSPATLEWTFSGRRKLMPTLDLTLVKIKPGEGMIRDEPGADSGKGPDRGHFWNWATHSISDLLHTE
jgi:hypothetical protein